MALFGLLFFVLASGVAFFLTTRVEYRPRARLAELEAGLFVVLGFFLLELAVTEYWWMCVIREYAEMIGVAAIIAAELSLIHQLVRRQRHLTIFRYQAAFCFLSSAVIIVTIMVGTSLWPAS